MKKMKNALVLSILLSGTAWTGVTMTMTKQMEDPMVAKLIDKLEALKVTLKRQADAWWKTCNAKPFWQVTWCKGAQVSSRLFVINGINTAIEMGKKVGKKAIAALQMAVVTAEKHTK